MKFRTFGILLAITVILSCICFAAPPDSANTPDGNVEQIMTQNEQAGETSGNISTPAEEKGKSLRELFSRGGLFMWPILFCAALALGFIIERFIAFGKYHLTPREFIDDLETMIADKSLEEVDSFCKSSRYPVAQILHRGLGIRHLGPERVEKSLSVIGSLETARLERGLGVLSAIGNITPMLGFLGTVSGMINAFSRIAAADQVSARIVASGIEEALVTSAAGLIVAIPALFFYNYFIHRIDIFVLDIERFSVDVIEKIMEIPGEDKA